MSTPSSSPSGGGLKVHLRALMTWRDHKRPLGFLVVAALSAGLPVLCGAWLNAFGAGVSASIGGLAVLYLRQTPLAQRMVTLAVVSFGFCVCFTLASLVGFSPAVSVLGLGLIAFGVTVVCRYFAVPPPGSFFFILVACIALAAPFDPAQLATRTGLLLFGCLGACGLGLLYSLAQLATGRDVALLAAPAGETRLVAIVLESATIAAFIAASYLMALALGFDKPYWAPISCAAILQGATFRDVWHRNVHRVFGTVLGMGVAWLIFSLQPGVWTLAVLITVLSFVIEALVTRHYGLAVVFITPLTIILAEAMSASADVNAFILMRMIDIVIGSSVGYVGGWVIHQRPWFAWLEARLRR